MVLFNALLDFVLNPLFIFSLLFWLIVLLLSYLLRNKKEAAIVFFPLLAMFKTKKLNNFIKRASKKAPKFWKIFWTIGIFISFGFTIFALYFFFSTFINLIINPKPEQAVVPIIPGVTIDLSLFLTYLILPILFIVTTHELAHGISASVEGVDIKSTGVLGAGLFYIIGFGAFVEVDERLLNSSKIHRNTRLRIAAAGTYINGITAGIAFILLLSFPVIISPFYRQVTQVNTVLKPEEGGFNYGNLTNGDVILAIKKKGAIDDDYVYLDEYKDYTLTNILNNKTKLKCAIGENLTLKIYNPSNDDYSEKNITLGPRYYIGIEYEYISNNELRITKIYSESQGGNNYNKSLPIGQIIDEINGIPIDVENGYTLELVLTTFNLKNINLTMDSNTWILEVDTIGVVIGIYSKSYFMHKNEIAKFFTSFTPEFLYRELFWLFVIAFSITLFNMLPLPVFDGDRIVKELVNWGIGEDYKTLKKKRDTQILKRGERDLELSEYRVEKVDSVKFILEDQLNVQNKSEILLAKEKYELIDKIGDGFKDTVSLNLPEHTKLKEGTAVEISYEYWYDEKKRIKRTIINTLRGVTLFIVAGNFILSFIKFGALIFWI